VSWKRRFGLVVVALLLVWLFLATLPAPVSFPHPFFSSHPRARQSLPQAIAHRGGWGLWPEHTVDGYQRAVSLGVDALELDVRPSADGVLVVFHDRKVDRVTEAQGAVASLSLAKLQSLDAGYDWSADDGATHPFRGQGLSIPTLAEVLSAFPDQYMTIELKTDDAASAEQLCGLLRDFDHEERAIVAAFKTESLDAFRQACPNTATSASSTEGMAYWVLHLLRLDVLASTEFEAFQVPPTLGPLPVVDRRFVQVTQGRGIPVQVWTIDEKEEMERLIELGVQGIITRRPDRLTQVLDNLRRP
jgi:glycerophosphoryl diester phosphodiesterase